MIDIPHFTKEQLDNLIAKIVSAGYDYVIRNKHIITFKTYIS